jgi:hypothetical protein
MRQTQAKGLKRMAVRWATLFLMAGLAWGCCAPSALERDYGRSVTNNLAQQVVNPQAGLETAPAAGLVPRAGTNLYGKYEKGFAVEEPKAALQLITQ